MNRGQRQSYFAVIHTLERETADALSEARSYSLCHLCRHVEWNEEGAPVCRHPLPVLGQDGDHCSDVWSGCDCWGFRPDGRSPDEAARHVRYWIDQAADLEADV